MLLGFMVARAFCLVLAIQFLDGFWCCVDVVEVDDERRKREGELEFYSSKL
jgi:hypothetical protein